MQTYTLSEMVEKTGAPRRAIQFWSDAGVLMAEGSTDRAGRGVHRQFSRKEAVIACAVQAFAARHVSVGELKNIAAGLRNMLENESSWARIQRAITGTSKVLLAFATWENTWEVHLMSSTSSPAHAKKGFSNDFKSHIGMDLSDSIDHLEDDGGFMAIICLNTYLAGLR